MKIPLDIRKKQKENGEKHIYCELTGIPNCRKPHFFGHNITFMVDTGATMECTLTESDADLLGISLSGSGVNELPDEDCPNAWSGTLKTYTIKKVELLMRGIEEGKEKLFHGNIDVCYISTDIDKGIPSVIGTRFLVKNNLRLMFSPNEDEAYLEVIE